MKKFFGKAVSIVLVVSMLAGMSIFAFAEDKPVYACLGDSNAAGYGTTDYVYSRIPAPNAYHTLIADELGAELRPIGTSGFRTDELRYILDPEFEPDWSYFQNYLLATYLEGDNLRKEVDLCKEDCIKAVEEADYITIQIGSNDVVSDAMGFAMGKLYEPVEMVESIRNIFNGVGLLDETMNEMLDTVASAIQMVNFLVDLYQRIQETYGEFYENWDAIIKNICRLNPDVTIVAIGPVNPLNNTSLLPGSPIKTCKIFDVVFEKLNQWIAYGSEYADTYYYCDITDITLGELAMTQEDYWDVYLTTIHPTDADHAEITKRVIEIIKTGKDSRAQSQPEGIFDKVLGLLK